MVSEFLINIVFNIVSVFLSGLPDISWSVDTTAFDYFIGIIQVVGYLLPMDTVANIAGLVVALTIFRIGVAGVKTIWDLLPLA